MNCPEHIVLLMHEQLDGDILPEDERTLKEHLSTCKSCQQHFYELEKSIALVQSTSHVEAPAGFTANVMEHLPKEKRRVSVRRWFQTHPFIVAASFFLILMGTSIFSSYSNDQTFSVSRQSNLIVENNNVIVPEGEVVKGDVVVKNGNIRIEGKVEGSVTVVNGEQYTASAGQVTGKITVIDEMFEWLWYKIKSIGSDMIGVFE
ncbi:anti-sigma-W factor RsiW [Bacillus gobiensis]|uniref:anti-sigma-W factor RsiW n=1 Tax=Bacillus gobiensis TaxID=1441095 RepID=UPI003D1E0DDA